MLKLYPAERNGPMHLRELLQGPPLRRIAVAGHCYGCTARQGSSSGCALG